MNNKFHADFGVNVEALPLKNIKQIKCGNACRVDWEEVCPHTKEEEVFVFGNPPYLGYVLQDNDQKDDLKRVFGNRTDYKKLDYITCWFYKAAEFIKDTVAVVGFVSTNSITQGEQIALLWPSIFDLGISIYFAYHSLIPLQKVAFKVLHYSIIRF